MQAGLSGHLEKHDMKMDGWKDPSWIVHLFGNEKREEENFSSGALVFYPAWFNKIGFEVINPHSRTRRAGTQPIYYEVVPAGTQGELRLLYAPLPGEIERHKVGPADFIDRLIESIEVLLETYGISAKRTAGWGTARIDDSGWRLHPGNSSNINTAEGVVREIKKRFSPQGGAR
jgi:CRISPR-associated protein Cmr2